MPLSIGGTRSYQLCDGLQGKQEYHARSPSKHHIEIDRMKMPCQNPKQATWVQDWAGNRDFSSCSKWERQKPEVMS